MAIPEALFQTLTTELQDQYKNINLKFSYHPDTLELIFNVQNTSNGVSFTDVYSEREFYETQVEPEYRFKSIFSNLIRQAGGRLK